LLGDIARVTAEQVRTTGIDWTFAPTVTVPQDDRWGRAYEGYSEDPGIVASYAGAFVKGLQGDPAAPDFLKGYHVLSSTKHFLADGGTENGRDQGDAKIPETTLRDIHNAGYVPAIESGVQTIMISFSSWNGKKLTGNKGLITDVLKKRMNFDGFTVGDWNAHGQVEGCTNDNCPQALNAGLDMYMAPDSWRGLYDNTLKQVKDGTIPMERLDDAVTRILRVKFRSGVFEAGPPSKRPLAGDFKMLNLARAACPRAPVGARVAGACSRTTATCCRSRPTNMCWWPVTAPTTSASSRAAGPSPGRARVLSNADFPGSTSVWAGVKAAVKAGGGTAELSTDGSYKKKPDVAIVVFGENPYAEFQGDLKVLTLPGSMTQHLEIMKKVPGREDSGGRRALLGSPAVAEPRAEPRQCLSRRVAAGHRGWRYCRRVVPQEGRLGQPRLQRQAVLLVAARRQGRAAQTSARTTTIRCSRSASADLRRAGRTRAAVRRSGHPGRAHVDRARSSTRARPWRRGRCVSRTAPTPRASPRYRPRRWVVASR
jgi:beta-glucosidase